MKIILVYASVFTLLSGCTFIPADRLDNPNNRNIRVTNIPPDMHCKYIGEIHGSQGNWFTGIFTSNAYLIMGARNNLKNRAAKHGANYVYTNPMPIVGPAFMTGDSFTAISAEAYHCEKPNTENRIIQKNCGYFSLCLHNNEASLEMPAEIKKEVVK